MALPEQVSEFSFAAGLSEHEDAWLQQSGFQRLENCLQDKAGSLVKLPGYGRFSDAIVNATGETVQQSTIGGAPKLIARGGQIGAIANGYLYAKNTQWVLQGRVSPWVAEQRTVVDLAPRKSAFATGNYSTVRHDCCRSGNWAFTAFACWSPGDLPANARICVACTYLPTGATVYQMITDSEAYGLSAPRIVAWDLNGSALLAYAREQNPPVAWKTICYRKVSPGTMGPEVDTGLTCSVFDVATDVEATGGGRAWIVYHPADSGSSTDQEIALQEYTIGSTALIPGADEAVATTGVPRSVAVTGLHSANRVSVIYAETQSLGGGNYLDNVTAFCRESSAIATQVWPTLPATSLDLGGSLGTFNSGANQLFYRVTQLAAVDLGGTSGTYFLFFDPNGALADYGGEFTAACPTTRGARVDATGNVSPTQQAGRTRMRSRPFFDGTRVCFLGEHSSGDALDPGDPNSYYALLGVEPFGAPPPLRFRPLGHFAHLSAPALPWSGRSGDADGYWMQSTPYRDGDSWTVQALERDPGTLRLRLRAYRLVSDDRVGVSVELGGQAYIVGALLSAWDGLRALEAGWLSDPVIEEVSQVAGTLAAGTRYYALTYARTNAAGELLRSRPSRVVTATNDAAEDNRLQIAPYCLSNRVDGDHLDMYVEIWRTKAGQTSPFWLAARLPLDPTNRDVQRYDDALPDASLGSVGLFPQTLPFEEAPGAELPNDPPISPVHACAWRNRLWLTDGEQIAYSKEGLPSRAAEFSLLQTIPRATERQLTAVAPLGDVLMAFTEDSTAYVYGDGPAANGQGSSLTGPIALQTELGCAQPAGLCVTPQGVLVPTRGGLQVLNLKREYSDVGLAIERAFAARPRVRCADWQLGTDRVWVVLSNQAGTDSAFAIWDMLHNTWSTALEGFDPCSVLSVGDVQIWMDDAGIAHEPAVLSWRIGDAEYAQRLETPWFKPGGALAEIRFRRAWLLAEQPTTSTSGLAISLAYDFEEEFSHAATFTPEAIAAAEAAGNGVLMLRVPAPRQRCHAFRLRLEELLPATDPVNQANTAGFRFVAMRLLTALRGAKGPLKASRNAGSGFVSE